MEYTILGSEALNLDVEIRFLRVEITMKKYGDNTTESSQQFLSLKAWWCYLEIDTDATLAAIPAENYNIDNAFLYETIEPNENRNHRFWCQKAAVESDNKVMLFDAGDLGRLLQEEKDILIIHKEDIANTLISGIFYFSAEGWQ